jgi:hypothetical protein
MELIHSAPANFGKNYTVQQRPLIENPQFFEIERVSRVSESVARLLHSIPADDQITGQPNSLERNPRRPNAVWKCREGRSRTLLSSRFGRNYGHASQCNLSPPHLLPSSMEAVRFSNS